MSTHFSSKNVFKFVNTLYKKAKANAYRDMLKRHQVGSKHEFIRRSVDDTLDSTQYWMCCYSGKSARTKQAHALWRCEMESRVLHYFSPDTLKIKTFKKLNKKSGLLAILITASQYERSFTWSELVTDFDCKKVWHAYNIWKFYAMTKYKNKSFQSYSSNYYNSYRSWLHKIGAIKQTSSKGRWIMTDFGKNMTEELLAYTDKKSKK